MSSRRPLPAILAAVVAAASGALGVLAFPRAGIWPLAIVSVAGLCLAVQGQRPRRLLWLGYLYGWAFFGPLLSWTGTFVGAVWLLLPFAEAAFIAVLALLLAVVQRHRGAVLWIACLWVGQEALRDRLPFGGFPWGRLAFSQSASPLRWFATLGGAPLVTFATALAGAGLWWLIESLAVRRGARAWRPAALAVVVVAAVPLLALGVGAIAGPPASPQRTATIALVQGDVPDRGLEFNARRRQVLDNHVQRTLQLAADVRAGRVARPELVVWPENASDIDPLENADARAQITRAVDAVGVPILVGAILDGPGATHVSNVGILWSPGGGPGDRYVKRHPVPFGEYLPLRSLALKISSKASLIARDMVAGDGNGLVRGGPFPIGDVICFEVAYDGLVRSSVRAGAQLVVVQTNNATFGHSAETYQQLAMSRLRAVETGRTVVQVATSGKSAVIAPDGTISAQSGALFTPAVIVRPVALSTSITLGVRLGIWPEVVLSAVGLAAVIGAVTFDRRRRRPRPADPSKDEELVGA